MDPVRIIEVKESIFENNDQEANKVRDELKAQKTFLLNLMSSPGAGKTTTLVQTVKRLKDEMRIAQERLQSLIDENDPTVTVTATTAIPMDELLRVKAKSTAEALFRAPVYLVEHVDPSIMGGIVLEGQGKRFDASVSAQLTAIHRELVRKRSQGGA